MSEEKSLPKPPTDLPLPEKELTSSEPQTGQSNIVVKNEKPGGKSPILKFVLLGVLFVIGLSLIAGAYVMGKSSSNQTAETQVVSSTTPTPDPTASWKTYENANYGFQVKYPRNVNGDEWVHEEFTDSPEGMLRFAGIGFGPPESKSGGYRWGINLLSGNLENIIEGIGGQFSDRKEARNNISLSGFDATLVTVTTNKYADWISKSVIFEKDGMVYVISNGAVDDPNFENFYKSFRFIKSTISTKTPTTPTPSITNGSFKIEEISPVYLPSNYASTGNNRMTVAGAMFKNGAKVTIEGPYDLGTGEIMPGGTYTQYYLENVSVSKSVITGTIPEGLPDGYFKIVVKNPDGESASTGLSLLRGSSTN